MAANTVRTGDDACLGSRLFSYSESVVPKILFISAFKNSLNMHKLYILNSKTVFSWMHALALSGRKLFYNIPKTEVVPRRKHAVSSSP